MAANEGFDNDLDYEPEIEKVVKQRTKPAERPGLKIRPKRIQKPKILDEYETNPDEPDEMSENERFDDEDISNSGSDDDDDPSFENTRSDGSYSPDIHDDDDDSLHSLDMFGELSFQDCLIMVTLQIMMMIKIMIVELIVLPIFISLGSDDNSVDLSLVKQELGEEAEGDSRANGILASSQEMKVIEIGGYRVETYGDYSKCPKCEKNIKSTFIIRHIKLHDLPSNVMKCPYESCATSFTR